MKIYPARFARKRTVIVVVTLVVVGVTFGPVLSARASLLSRVNEALQESGFELTHDNWQPFAAGVVIGHYKTFDQLASAAQWHKQQGTLPSESKFAVVTATTVGKVAGATTAKTTCAIGQVKGISLLKKVKNKPQEGRLTLQYEKKTKQGKKTFSKVVTQLYKLSKKQYDVAVKRGVIKGRQSKVCTKGALTGKLVTVVGNVLNLTPAADPDDSSGGGGGGSSEGGGGAAAGS